MEVALFFVEFLCLNSKPKIKFYSIRHPYNTFSCQIWFKNYAFFFRGKRKYIKKTYFCVCFHLSQAVWKWQDWRNFIFSWNYFAPLTDCDHHSSQNLMAMSWGSEKWPTNLSEYATLDSFRGKKRTKKNWWFL